MTQARLAASVPAHPARPATIKSQPALAPQGSLCFQPTPTRTARPDFREQHTYLAAIIAVSYCMLLSPCHAAASLCVCFDMLEPVLIACQQPQAACTPSIPISPPASCLNTDSTPPSMAAATTLQPTDPFFQIFQRERQSIWERNQHLSDFDREALWTRRKAELASFITQDATQHVQAAHTPRSLSNVPTVRRPAPFGCDLSI